MISKLIKLDVEDVKQKILNGIHARLEGKATITMRTLDYKEYPQNEYLCLSFTLNDMTKAIAIEYAAGAIPIPEIASGIAQQFRDEIIERYFIRTLITSSSAPSLPSADKASSI